MLSGIHNDYMSHGKSSVPDDKILSGRPYGGLGILWRKSMAINVQAIDINSDRIAGILITLADKSTSMILNVYLPTDLRSMTHVSQEYEMCIDMLEMCINRYAYDKIVIGGDFNTDFSRKNAHSEYLNHFLERNLLLVSGTWLVHRGRMVYIRTRRTTGIAPV